MVDAVSGSIASTGQSRSEIARKGLADNFDNFLVLLTTQLKNQDPTSPMDSNQFTQQLVSFAQVEQAVNTNDNLEKLLASNESSQLNSAVSYLGKMVQSKGNSFTLANGQADLYYTMEEASKQTSITITDAAGRTVAVIPAETSAGQHHLAWDGKDQNKNPVPDGTYKVQVSAMDADGNFLPVTTGVTNVVGGVAMEDGKPVLYVGDKADIAVALEDVTAVRFKQF